MLGQGHVAWTGLCRKETNEVVQGAIENALGKHETQTTLIGFIGRGVSAWIVALLVCGFSAMNVGAATTGKQDFEENCASCHGKDGRGQGEALYVIPGIKPPDLTKLTRNNRGVFPAEDVYRSIDGRAGIPAHSRLDMPFWGTVFQEGGKEFTPESEAKAKERISNIVSYIKSIQQK
jgi:Cytochrome c